MPFDAEPQAEVTARDRMIRLRDFLAELPDEKFNMRRWGKRGCGSPACVAGWASRIFNRYIRSERGHNFLGLSATQARNLFTPFPIYTGRPPNPNDDYWSPFDATPRQVARVLDHYLATGEISWAAALKDGQP